jgi:hypothetical protein
VISLRIRRCQSLGCSRSRQRFMKLRMSASTLNDCERCPAAQYASNACFSSGSCLACKIGRDLDEHASLHSSCRQNLEAAVGKSRNENSGGISVTG